MEWKHTDSLVKKVSKEGHAGSLLRHKKTHYHWFTWILNDPCKYICVCICVPKNWLTSQLGQQNMLTTSLQWGKNSQWASCIWHEYSLTVGLLLTNAGYSGLFILSSFWWENRGQLFLETITHMGLFWF